MDLPRVLSGEIVGSFAYKTVKDRLPVILAKIVDDLYKNRNAYLEELGQHHEESLKAIITEVSKLRHEVTTDKKLLPLSDKYENDHSLWNAALQEAGSEASWFKSPWLLVECYMYRRLLDIVLQSSLQSFDVFRNSKISSYHSCEAQMRKVAFHLSQTLTKKDEILQQEDLLKSTFLQFLQLSLWGNIYDLSLSGLQQMDPTNPSLSVLELLALLQNKIVVNESESLWGFLQQLRNHSNNVGDGSSSSSKVLIVVLDNAGMEFVADLCLIVFLLKFQFFDKIIMYGKSIPWFVSDVTHADARWALHWMNSSNDIGRNQLVSALRQCKAHGQLEYRDHVFWTLPYPFGRMSDVAGDLYHTCRTEATLLLFKGDLNYRKLVGDLDWDPTTPKQVALPASLHKAQWLPCVALRVMKSDTVCGVEEAVVQKFAQEHDWRCRGEFAMIQSFLQ